MSTDRIVVPKNWVVTQIKIYDSLVKDLKKENKTLLKSIRRDIYGIVDTRDIEFRILNNKKLLREYKKELRALKKLLKNRRVVFDNKVFVIKSQNRGDKNEKN